MSILDLGIGRIDRSPSDLSVLIRCGHRGKEASTPASVRSGGAGRDCDGNIDLTHLINRDAFQGDASDALVVRHREATDNTDIAHSCWLHLVKPCAEMQALPPLGLALNAVRGVFVWVGGMVVTLSEQFRSGLMGGKMKLQLLQNGPRTRANKGQTLLKRNAYTPHAPWNPPSLRGKLGSLFL